MKNTSVSLGLNLLEERAAPKTAGFQGSPPFSDFRVFRGSFIDSLLASQQCHPTGLHFAVQFV